MGLTVPAASVVVTIDPTVVAGERMDRFNFNLYDLLLPAGDPVVTLDAAVGPGVGGFVVADGPEVETPDIIPDTRYNAITDGGVAPPEILLTLVMMSSNLKSLRISRNSKDSREG